MTRVTDVSHFPGGFLVTFDGQVGQQDAEHLMFPSGVPAGVEVVAHHEQVALLHLSLDATLHMEPQLATMISEASVLTTGGDGGRPDWVPGGGGGGAAAPAQPRPRPPGFPDPSDKDAVKAWMEGALEGTHYIAGAIEVAEAFAGEAVEFISVAAEVLGPIGDVAMLAVIFVAVIEAFHAGEEATKKVGYSYGLCWQAFGESNHDKVFYDWADDSAEDRRKWFFEGVEQGRAKAQDTKVHNAIVLLAAQHMVSGDSASTAQWQTLNEIDAQISGEYHGNQEWPKPHDDYV
jgi:hypothetical protein